MTLKFYRPEMGGTGHRLMHRPQQLRWYRSCTAATQRTGSEMGGTALCTAAKFIVGGGGEERRAPADPPAPPMGPRREAEVATINELGLCHCHCHTGAARTLARPGARRWRKRSGPRNKVLNSVQRVNSGLTSR
jgi:hypothetical protein